ncbi:MAG: hypothetical protein LBU87_04800 [Lactobacillales bacterium]|jgi:hypothetical protein|nr:hypothetical protein [Lactobacillales bacterium]
MTREHKNAKENESGRSMVEMLTIVSIIAVITIAAMESVRYAMFRFRVVNIQNEAENIAMETTKLYSSYRSMCRGQTDSECSQNIQKTVCNNKIIPLGCSNDVGINLYGGSILVGIDGRQLTVKYTQVPESVCFYLKDPALTTWSIIESVACRCEGTSLNGVCKFSNDTYALEMTVK